MTRKSQRQEGKPKKSIPKCFISSLEIILKREGFVFFFLRATKMAFTTTNVVSLRSPSLYVSPRFPPLHHPRNPPLRLSFPYTPSFNLSLKTAKTTLSSSTSPTTLSFAKPSPQSPFSDSTKSLTTLALRDLCDPYLNLFRNIIPPVFDTLDVSPLLAFAVLGTLGSIFNNSR